MPTTIERRRYYAPRRKLILQCIACQQPFYTTRQDALYHSQACRQAAYRLRQARARELRRKSRRKGGRS